MTRDDIIRMAREAGWTGPEENVTYVAMLERFANLVAATAEREWQGLTDEEIMEEYRQSYGDDGNLTDIYFAHAIEAKLKEKNSG